MKDLINGGKGYEKMATFVVRDNAFDVYSLLQKNHIIFCKTDYLTSLFISLRFSSRKYILISHYSDFYINENLFNQRPNCIKKWFAIATAYKHPDLIQIPVGFGLFPEEEGPKEQWFYDNIDRLRDVKKSVDVVFCNYRVDNLRPPRGHVIDELSVKYYQPEDENAVNGRQVFQDYCESMAKYRFVISPPGNGIDSHRNWESLYMGCCPIVIKNLIYENYKLPIFQVCSFKEIDNEKLEYFNYYYHQEQSSYNYDHYKLSYWKNRILKEFNKINE